MAREINSLANFAAASSASALQSLMLDTELADLTVTCGDKEWKVHSVILAVRSPFFRAAVTNNMMEKLNMKTDIKDFDPEAMEEVINFMYGVPKETAPVKLLVEAAERFQMDDLKEYVVKLAKKGMTIENVIELGHLAETYGNEELIAECAKFIVRNDVPLTEEDISPKLAIMVMSNLKSNNRKWSLLHDITLNGQLFEYVGRGDYGDAGSAQALVPLSTKNHYFEVEIIEPGTNCYIAIGLDRKNFPDFLASWSLPGWSKGSIGYHADDGDVYIGSGDGEPFGPICNRGDIMGCGILFPSNYVELGYSTDDCLVSDFEKDEEEQKVHVYFTKNGKYIGMKEVVLPEGGFFPAVGMMSCGEKVRVDLKPDFNPVSIE